MSVRETVLTIALAVLCCALPLLLIGGVSVGAGVFLGEIALVMAGLGVIAFAAYELARRGRAP